MLVRPSFCLYARSQPYTYAIYWSVSFLLCPFSALHRRSHYLFCIDNLFVRAVLHFFFYSHNQHVAALSEQLFHAHSGDHEWWHVEMIVSSSFFSGRHSRMSYRVLFQVEYIEADTVDRFRKEEEPYWRLLFSFLKSKRYWNWICHSSFVKRKKNERYCLLMLVARLQKILGHRAWCFKIRVSYFEIVSDWLQASDIIGTIWMPNDAHWSEAPLNNPLHLWDRRDCCNRRGNMNYRSTAISNSIRFYRMLPRTEMSFLVLKFYLKNKSKSKGNRICWMASFWFRVLDFWFCLIWKHFRRFVGQPRISWLGNELIRRLSGLWNCVSIRNILRTNSSYSSFFAGHWEHGCCW